MYSSVSSATDWKEYLPIHFIENVPPKLERISSNVLSVSRNQLLTINLKNTRSIRVPQNQQPRKTNNLRESKNRYGNYTTQKTCEETDEGKGRKGTNE